MVNETKRIAHNAAPDILEQAARELLEDEWKKRTTSKLPQTANTLQSGQRMG